MQQITNLYLDFGKELIAKHSGLGYYYDSISLIHPEYEEESGKQPENHNYITNITKLQILKEYNELFQNNLTFLTQVMSKRVVEKIYPSFEVRVEKKISELLPQAEKEITDSITEKYLSLKSREETQNLAVFKQILQEKQITSQLSEKQVLQTIRNIENYENSLSHYEDVYTRQIRQTVEMYAGIAVQPPALAKMMTEAMTEPAAESEANRQIGQKKRPAGQISRFEDMVSKSPARVGAGDLVYHEDSSKDDDPKDVPIVTQHTDLSDREKELIHQEVSQMVDRLGQPGKQSADRKTSHTVEKQEKPQNRQEDNTISSRIAQIIHQQIQQKQQQDRQYQDRQQQDRQHQQKQNQGRQQLERKQQEKLYQQEYQQERQQQQKQQQEKQQTERQKLEKQRQEKLAETYHTNNVNNVNNRLINTANQLTRLENTAVHNPAKEPVSRSNYENSDLVYLEDSQREASESIDSSIDQSGHKGELSVKEPATPYKAQGIERAKEMIRHEVSQAANQILQQERKQDGNIVNNRTAQIVHQQEKQTQKLEKQQEKQRENQLGKQYERQLGKQPGEQFQDQPALSGINNHLHYGKTDLVYSESPTAENQIAQGQANQSRINSSQTNQSGIKQSLTNQSSDRQNNRFVNNRTLKIAQTINQLNRLENSMVHNHTTMIVNRINHGDSSLVYNNLIFNSPAQKDFSQIENLMSNQTINQSSHRTHPTIDSRSYPTVGLSGYKAGNMQSPVELVYEARPDNQTYDASNITAGEQTHIQEKTIENVVKDIEFVKETKKIVKNQVHETILQKDPEKETEVVWEGAGRNSRQVMEQLQKTIDRKVDESVGQIADRVYRNLEERLRSERNRRGY